jgi:hypothetical protein
MNGHGPLSMMSKARSTVRPACAKRSRSSVSNLLNGALHACTTALLPTILVGLTAFITTVVIEAIYFVCHLLRCQFDGSALLFSWTEPLPVAGLSTVAVLLAAILAARLMRLASEDAPEPFAVKQTADNNTRQANLAGSLEQGGSVEPTRQHAPSPRGPVPQKMLARLAAH